LIKYLQNIQPVNSSSSFEAARRIVVRGRVQGVYFRASTARRARELSVRGLAQNLPDGSVLVLAAGDVAALEELTRWLRQGPPMARVDSLESEPVDPAEFAWPAGFAQK
jgi:acylphosphatase